MERIASFCVDHTKLDRGMYLSRQDGDVLTWDIRMKKPNQGDYLTTGAAHTLEHLFATYARNSAVKNGVIYVGPMGCRTGFYLLTRGLTPAQALELTVDSFRFMAAFEGDIPLKGGHEAEGIHGQLQCLCRGQPAGEQVEAGAAAHGANVDHAVLHRAVAGVGGKQVLQRVGGTGGQVIALIGLLHPDVPGQHITVLAAQVHAPVQFGVIDTEACNAFHDVLLQDQACRRWTLPWAQSTAISRPSRMWLQAPAAPTMVGLSRELPTMAAWLFRPGSSTTRAAASRT